jgi:methylenetetrahydrofolate reductase (NADPH)
VPHFAAQRLSTRAALRDRVKAMAEAGVDDVLIVGGGLAKQAGEFSSSMEVLETNLFDAYGIKDIAIAGHPEGSPDFSEAKAIEALQMKAAFGEQTNAQLRIVTQFGFDADPFIGWTQSPHVHGVTGGCLGGLHGLNSGRTE